MSKEDSTSEQKCIDCGHNRRAWFDESTKQCTFLVPTGPTTLEICGHACSFSEAAASEGEKGKATELSPLVVTRNGIPCPDQAAALREFKAACLKKDSAASDEQPYRTHVTSCEACSGPHGHCTEGLRLLNASTTSEGIPKMSDAEFYARGIARSRYHDKLFAEGRTRPTNEQFDEGWAAAMAFAASPSVDEAAVRRAAEKVVDADWVFIDEDGPSRADAIQQVAEIISTELNKSDSGKAGNGR